MFGRKIADAAYKSMMDTITSGKAPNLLVAHYDPGTWTVKNLLLIPQFVFTRSMIERRKPLLPGARRAGWVGCNIVLANVPDETRINLIKDGRAFPPAIARRRYRALRPLQQLRLDSRGWTLDVWTAVQRLDKREFSLREVYALAHELGRLHPKNRNVEPKIRQQLQRLRDMGFVEFLDRGRYRLRGRGAR